MSLMNWIRNGKLGIKTPSSPILPDPVRMEETSDALVTTSCNEEVENVMRTPIKRKRGEYGNYSPETRAKIARYAIDNGPAKASRHFTTGILGRNVNESTIRSLKKLYLSSPSKNKDQTLPHSPRGRPLKLGEYDDLVKTYVRKLRLAGGIVNTQIVMAGAKGVLLYKDKTLLKENGGNIEITKDWARSLLIRMGFSKRKGTKGVKHLPDDFDEIQSKFIERINENVMKYKIPDALVINWDQTGVNLVPCGDWTMNETGAKQVPIKGVDDKRQITALLAVAKSGDILPPQLLYQGLSDKCHPVHKFPDDWDIFHSENHWSNAETMRRYVDKVVVPYVDKIKEELDLPLKQKALCVFDVFKAHQDKGLLKLLEENDIKVVFVPAACTDRLQPLDIQINGKFKSLMKSEFQSYYANEVKIALEKGTDITEIDIDLRLSKIKPIHAKWIVKCIDKLAHERELIASAFTKAGM